jgi:hypothetical protein
MHINDQIHHQEDEMRRLKDMYAKIENKTHHYIATIQTGTKKLCERIKK